ncbi:MAG: CHASE2 domain-containing protein [Rhodothermaceae bacterium]
MIVIVTLITVTQDFLFPLSFLKTLELKTIDNLFAERGEINISDSSDVIILEITDDTYQQLPPSQRSWPWPRSVFARVIENLNEAGVKVIGIDLVMASPDQYDLKNDFLLSATIKKYDNVVVAGQIDIAREQIIDKVKNQKLNSGTGVITKNNENYGNIFYAADSSIGLVNVPSDYDGVYRSYRPFIYSAVTNDSIPTFSFAVLNKLYKKKQSYRAENKTDFFEYENIRIPKYASNSILINYYSLEKDVDFKHIKLIDVLDDKDFKTIDEIEFGESLDTWDNPDYGILHSGIFKDKIVLIGSTMPEDKDQFPVTLSGESGEQNLMYGVKIHASVIQNVIDKNFIHRQNKLIEILQIIIFVLLGFYLSSALKKIITKTILVELISVVSLSVVIYLFYLLSKYLFIEKNILILYLNSTVALAAGYFSSAIYNVLRERQQNAMIKGMFGYYVSRELVNELIADPDKLKLGGENRELSILFSDIVGFSTLSEKMTADELVTLMNEYLSAMTQIVLNNKGTLDKYIGDAVMAFWNAPVNVETHALEACKSALLMRKKVDDLQIEWNRRGIPLIDIRIGINTGKVVVGNMGGEKRFDYTVMGDEVNLASRLEGTNKQYGTHIIISDTTYAQVSKKIVTRKLDTIIVKGKTKPTTIYELIGLADEQSAKEKLESLDLYFKGLEMYEQKEFKTAGVFFQQSYEKTKDQTSYIYMERCRFYIENPPSKDWKGVFTMTTK